MRGTYIKSEAKIFFEGLESYFHAKYLQYTQFEVSFSSEHPHPKQLLRGRCPRKFLKFGGTISSPLHHMNWGDESRPNLSLRSWREKGQTGVFWSCWKDEIDPFPQGTQVVNVLSQNLSSTRSPQKSNPKSQGCLNIPEPTAMGVS